MRLFVYNWNFITKVDLYAALKRQGIDIYLFSSNYSPRNDSEKLKFLEEAAEAFKASEFDAIFSVNFFNELSTLAKDNDVLYISWTYDSPALGRNNPSLLNDCNRIFCFDSDEMNKNLIKGAKNIFYLPLAVDCNRFNKIKATPMQQMKFTSQVSLVGQLYQSDMDKIYPLFDEYNAGFVSSIINTQLKVYGINVIENLITDSVVEGIMNEDVEKALLENINDRFLREVDEIRRWPLTLFLSKAVTNKERILLLTLLGNRYNVKHYSFDNMKLGNVHKMGLADMHTEMPLVFRYSKINLNTTLKSIKSGMPQRILDIMACHGLCMSNYQADIFRHFEDGKEILVYSSMEEAVDKCDYYLRHEDEAEAIRRRAYNVVKNDFTYDKMLNKIWEISGVNS